MPNVEKEDKVIHNKAKLSTTASNKSEAKDTLVKLDKELSGTETYLFQTI